jgi:hypothetical protein
MKKTLTIVFVLTFLVPLTLNAALITTNSITNPTIIDFSQFTSYSSNPFNGPVQVGGLVGRDVTISGNPYDGTKGAWLYNSSWGLGSNGYWDSGRNGYAGYAWGPGYIEFSFNDSSISAVGAFMNDYPGGTSDLIISAYGTSGLLESYNITNLAPIITPSGTNAGDFRGIQRASDDIIAFRVYGYVPVVDDLTFSSAVPLPPTVLLLGSGLLGLVGWRRLRKG